MMIPATQIRVGTLVIYNGELHRVHDMVHKTPGNLRGFVQVKMRNLRSGSMAEQRFGSTDRVEKASLDEREMEYLYSDSAGHHFMDQQTYDQVTLSEDVLGEQMKYLLPNTAIHVDFYDGNPVGIELPNTVTLKVTETQPGMKGATASASYKPATLETGLQVMVPQFIEAGTRIKIDTRDNSYLERA
ncbi:MAG TPA: elongation factor P [Thermoanaerobaculia bacterium]|nr:elongation factor P [Thermoanaerobaculia bacterium]